MLYIVTVYDSLNYGSYYQAYALQKQLKEYDDVAFIDIHHQSTFKQTMIACLKKIIRFRFEDALLDYRKYLEFKKARKAFNLIDMNNVEGGIAFFGSDEIWNISRAKMKASKEFFGYNINTDKKISIAPSINTSTIEDFNNYSEVKDMLNDFDAISLRDKHSYDVISKLVDKDCEIIRDPTLLLKKDDYKQIQGNISDDNYILLYTYGKMLSSENVKAIKDFARNNNLKIISIGRYFKFCDKNVAASVEEFLAYMDKAKYVFTDTFHGTMFSIIYQKVFVSFSCGNTKVNELLDDFDLTDRIKDENSTIEDIIDNKTDYSKVEKIQDKYSRQIKDFIDKNVK